MPAWVRRCGGSPESAQARIVFSDTPRRAASWGIVNSAIGASETGIAQGRVLQVPRPAKGGPPGLTRSPPLQP